MLSSSGIHIVDYLSALRLIIFLGRIFCLGIVVVVVVINGHEPIEIEIKSCNRVGSRSSAECMSGTIQCTVVRTFVVNYSVANLL